MKAMVIHHYGSPDVLQYAEMPQPTIKPDQLLVKIQASSVNPVDWKIRKGMLKFLTRNKFPMVLGFDLCGEVLEVGENVTQFQQGDTIYAQLNGAIGGAYAEYAAVPENLACYKPHNMTDEEAATVPLAGLTALQGLRDCGGIQPGYKVLINGASGGVGTFAVQLAKAMEAEVTGVCSTANLELVRALGADRVIDYTQQDFTQENVRYDIIFDVVANQSFLNCKNRLKSPGVYVTTLPTPGNLFQTALTSIFPGKSAKFILVKPNGQDLAYLKQLIESERVKTTIAATYPLNEIPAAHARSETGHVTGKIAIAVAQ
jgi:NADPH:quinone reductase-like Zn-dependent oxidoreductase